MYNTGVIHPSYLIQVLGGITPILLGMTVRKKTTFVYSIVLLIPILTINDTVHLIILSFLISVSVVARSWKGKHLFRIQMDNLPNGFSSTVSFYFKKEFYYDKM